MKYLVILLVLVGCTAFVPHTFGTQQNLFEGNSIFERLPDTITPNTIYEFELKFQITDSPYWLHGISPVVDINPKTDASNVHISFEKIPSGFFAIYRVPVTLYVDQNISSEKIFLNVSFVSENSSGDELRSSWSESLVLNIDTANTNDKNYRFIDFSYAHMVGEPIKFTLEKMADDNCNSYDAEIIDEEGNFVLGWGAEISCDPDWASNSAPVQTKIGYKESHPIIINDSGKYYLKIEFDDVNINQEFVVRQNHSGASLDRTVYPVPWERSPLKQFNSGISFDEIHCKTGLVLIQKYDGSPACVTESTKQKLIERGWIHWNSLNLIHNDNNIYCTSNVSVKQCYSLEDIVFGNARKSWKVYPGAGIILPENSPLTPIYKNSTIGSPRIDLTAMLDDPIFVNKCETNGGIWNFTYHDCELSWHVCNDIGGIIIQQDISPSCTDTGIIDDDPLTVKVCRGGATIRNVCVFQYNS